MEKNNKLPNGWVQIKFESAVKNIPLTGKKLKQTEYLKEGKIPIIDQGQDFIGGYTDQSELIPTCNLPVIIFGDHTKVIKYVNQKFVAGADGIKVLEPKNIFIPKLLYYFIQIINLPNKGYARHYQYLEKSLIRVPPLAEQKRIVAKIEELFSKINPLNKLLIMTPLQLEKYRKSMLTSIYSKFDTKPLSTIAEINPHKPKTGKIHDNLEVSFIPMKCVTELTGNVELSNTRKYSEVKNGFTYFENGDIIFAKITPCMENGKIAIVQNLKNGIGCGSTEFHVIRLKNKISQKFYFWYLINDKFRNDAQKHMRGTAGQQRVPVQYLQESLVPTASLPEQKQVVLEIEKNIPIIQKNQEIIDKTIQILNNLKISILKQAFEGNLVPQDPNDESASILLERIKKSKN